MLRSFRMKKQSNLTHYAKLFNLRGLMLKNEAGCKRTIKEYLSILRASIGKRSATSIAEV